MTSKGSGAYQACRAAVEVLRERMPEVRVEVIDTLKVAMSQGWAAIEAARSALEGSRLARWPIGRGTWRGNPPCS